MKDLYSGELLAPSSGLELPIWDEEKKIPWQDARYLVLVLKNNENHTLTFNVDFYTDKKAEEYALRVTFSILPHIDCTVPIDLNLFGSQTLIVPRTKGRLRMMVYGKPLRQEEIVGLKLTILKCCKEQSVILRHMYLSYEMPDLTLPEEPLMDEMGQWIQKEWDSKLHSVEECTKILRERLDLAEKENCCYDNQEWDVYGGWKKKKFNKTGWFHVVEDGKRYWLADPEGNAFFSTGIDCMHAGNDTPVYMEAELCKWIPDRNDLEYSDGWEKEGRSFNYGIANLIRAFGRRKWKESFYKILKSYLYKWHINTIGNWSSLEFIRYAKMPYVLPLDAMGAPFPGTEKSIFRDFPDVFSEEYKQNAVKYAQNIKPFVDDPYLIGYFMRNEPSWGFVFNMLIAEEMLESEENFVSRQIFIRRLAEKYKIVEALNFAWNVQLSSFADLNKPLRHAADYSGSAREDIKEFSKEMIERYVQIPALELRKLDPNHLNLGMRYAFVTDPVMLSGHEYFDVFSMNLYQMSPYRELAEIGEILHMPIMIGEFHFGALDKGLLSTGLRAVASQRERGKAYRYYMEQGVKSGYFLGAHYFQLVDQNCLGRFDGENYQIGIVDLALQEYKDMTEIMTECNKHIYKVINGEQPVFADAVKEIPAVHC